MSNNRKAIRAAVQALLLNNTSAGESVFTNRETKYFRTELPSITIYSEEESAVNRDITARQYIRTYGLRIELKTEASDSVDDDLDDLAKEVEDILKADTSLTGTAISCEYKSSQISLSAEGDKLRGTLTLNYEVKYIG